MTAFLRPDALLLAIAVAADLALGDPVYAWHPVRLIGRTLSAIERALRTVGLNGHGGGIALFVMLTALSLAATGLLMWASVAISPTFARVLHVALVYSLLALGDLLHHVWRIERAVRANDLTAARAAVGNLVGRDTDRLDGAACRRAAVESLSESLTDGFVSPLVWYVLGGLPGIVIFKVVSTMDSMVGYKTDRYLKFGWCGARLDDAMNFVPARATWLTIAALAAIVPGCSARKAWRVGLAQHARVPGPNSGWSEAGTAGAIQCRIVGPIWRGGVMVTGIWIGDEGDPPLSSAEDMTRAMGFVTVAGVVAAAFSCLILWMAR